MDAIIEFITNGTNVYDIATLIRLFLIMIGIDGTILTLFAIIRGFNK